MGIWKDIRHALNSTLGTSNFKPLDQIMTGGDVKLVKSIQKGFSSSSSVTISTVNPSKCIVLLNSTSFEKHEELTDAGISHDYATITYSWAYNGWVALKTLTSTKFTVENLNEYSWQIIEFY